MAKQLEAAEKAKKKKTRGKKEVHVPDSDCRSEHGQPSSGHAVEELLRSVSPLLPAPQATWPSSFSQWSSAFTPPPTSAWWGALLGPFAYRPWDFNFRPQGPDPWTVPQPGAGTSTIGAVLDVARAVRLDELGSSAAEELAAPGVGRATTAVANRGGAIDEPDRVTNRGAENIASESQTPATTDEAPIA